MKREFKQENWVFCEFKLQQIKKMQGDDVKEVSDGMFTHSGILTDRCFHLDMKVKNASDHTQAIWDKINEIKKPMKFPDIHRELVRRWMEMCNEPDNGKLQELHLGMDIYYHSVIASSNYVDIPQGNGRI